ncbi:MAG: primosomal protein N' [bacterium]
MITASIVFNIPLNKKFMYQVPAHLSDTVTSGLRVKLPFGRQTLTGYVVGINEAHDIPHENSLKDIIHCLDSKPLITQELLDLSCWIADEYGSSQGEVLAGILAPGLTLKKEPKPLKKRDLSRNKRISNHEFVLTREQRTITESITESLRRKISRNILIHGVTGSGKTEIYLRAIAETLSRGRQALYLVPEISMTPLFIKRLSERFGDTVAVWHSRMSSGKRLSTWHAVHHGNIQIVLGARSAVFMPFNNLGVIIIDEEHDDSYKQDKKPYYHARAIARKRAETHNAVLILGSATPSIETYTEALRGNYSLFSIHERIDKKPMPHVHIIDLGHKQFGRLPEIFSEQLKNAIRQRIARREQIILFINRRGYAPFFSCGSCGWMSSCSDCSVSLVYHREGSSQNPGNNKIEKKHSYAHTLLLRPDYSAYRERLICHYCGKSIPLPQECPACKNKNLKLAGVGTQKVESEIKRLFPKARVTRLDRDTASKQNYYEDVYQDFSNEDIDILLGTQIVAKGFDFPRVTLVGVIDADIAIHMPDFRSAERTFQLLTQVAGRSGRSSLGGEVIVQTFYPNHYALKSSSKHDFKEFYDQEIEYRRSLGYPPFKRLMCITFRGYNESMVRSECERCSMALQTYKNSDTDILGPAPAIRQKLHRKFRWQLILKAPNLNVKSIYDNLHALKVKKGIQVSSEIDPVSLL